MSRREGQPQRWVWVSAIAPGVGVFLVEGAIWALTAVTDSESLSGVGTAVLAVGLGAAIVSVFVVFAMERRDALTWAIVSVCVSLLGLASGAAFLFLAEVHTCGPRCFD